MADGSPVSLSSRAASKAATRAKIVATAKSLFEARGFSGVDIRSIARAAGLSTGAVFASFSGKAELYSEATGEFAPVGALADAGPALHRALFAAEIFISGFEDDPSQDGVRDLLLQVREALARGGWSA